MQRRFLQQFDGMPSVCRAPARVNLMGEHTDYNDGLVLPTTTALHTWVAYAPREDGRINIHSTYAGEGIGVDLGRLEEEPVSKRTRWTDYVTGVAEELMREDIELRGADLLIDSTVPIGGGLSSSASLELAVAYALLDVCSTPMTWQRMAAICQRAESRAVGLQCGIMDQFAVAGCEAGKAMLLDCRTLDVKFVPIPESAALLVVDSGVRHQLPDGGYNDRRSECEQSLQLLNTKFPDLHSLCDLTLSQLAGVADQLGETLYRRCHHVVSENQRVAESVSAMRANDLASLGNLLNDSHVSLRDDFEISCDASDELVEMLNGIVGVHGARQIGGGFGGCILALVDDDMAIAVEETISSLWGDHIGGRPWTHIVAPTDPVGVADESAESAQSVAARR